MLHAFPVPQPLRRLALLAGLCIALPACAEHYGDHPAAADFIDELVAEDGFEREELEDLGNCTVGYPRSCA